jgi:hypothetical protein
MAAPAFPVFTTVRAAYADVFGNFPAFLRGIWLIWLLLFVLVDVPNHFVTQDAGVMMKTLAKNLPENTQLKPEEVMMSGHPVLKLPYIVLMGAFSCLQMMLVICFTVAWYVQLLRGENKGKTLTPRLGKREWNYAWTSLKVGFVLFPAFVILGGLLTAFLPQSGEGGPTVETYMCMVVAGLLALYLQARLSMSFPLTVLDHIQEPLKQSWDMTKKNSLPVMAGLISVFIPILLLMVTVILLLSVGAEALFAPGHVSAGEEEMVFPAPIVLGLKAVGSLFTLLIFGVLSAFQARAYAYFLRTQEGLKA